LADWDTPADTVAFFSAYYLKRGFDVKAVERAAVDRQSNFSIHEPAAIQFFESVIGASEENLKIVREGLIPKFTCLPGPYREDNNGSAKKHLDIVRDKVKDWLAAGHIERLHEPATCCNPLSVVVKHDPVSDKVKSRVVLDLSRHVNLGRFVNS